MVGRGEACSAWMGSRWPGGKLWTDVAGGNGAGWEGWFAAGRIQAQSCRDAEMQRVSPGAQPWDRE